MYSQTLFSFLDPFLIWAFRLPGSATAGFALGLVYVALAATIIGELCMAGVYFANKKHFASLTKQMISNNNLSIQALGAGDKASYTACNSLANDAFGKSFFARLALFAASIWPAALALGWLEYRFGGVDFVLPLVGEVSTAFFFLPAYILVRVAFHRAKPWLPLFKTIRQKIQENENPERMLSFVDLMSEEEDEARSVKLEA